MFFDKIKICDRRSVFCLKIWPARPTNLNLLDLRPVEAFVWNALDRKYVLARSLTDYFDIERVVAGFFCKFLFTLR